MGLMALYHKVVCHDVIAGGRNTKLSAGDDALSLLASFEIRAEYDCACSKPEGGLG